MTSYVKSDGAKLKQRGFRHDIEAFQGERSVACECKAFQFRREICWNCYAKRTVMTRSMVRCANINLAVEEPRESVVVEDMPEE